VRGVGRFFLRLLALLALSLTLPIIMLATIDALRRGGHDTGYICTNCGPATQPVAVFEGRVESRHDDVVHFRVDRPGQGDWTSGAGVEANGLDFVPWREYRVSVYVRDGTAYVSRFVEPKTLGLTRPAGVTSFQALPRYDALALAAMPLFLIAAVYLWMSSRNQGRRERDGVLVRGLRKVRPPRTRSERRAAVAGRPATTRTGPAAS
jgi:hypothetical protein